MPRGRPRKVGKICKSGSKRKKRGPDSPSDELRTKSVDEILGVEPIVFSESEEEMTEVATQNAEIEVFLQRSNEIQQSVKAGKSISSSLILFCESGMSNKESSLATVLEHSKCKDPIPIESSEQVSVVKITEEDVEEEVHFWNSALICYVLGANPQSRCLMVF